MYPPHWSPCISWGHVYEVIGRDTHGHPVYRCTRCQATYVTWTGTCTSDPKTGGPR